MKTADWIVTEYCSGTGCIVHHKEVTAGAVAHVFGNTEHECKANAQLIAEAPKLLEHLRGLIDAAGEIIAARDTFYYAEAMNELRAAADEAASACWKAEGMAVDDKLAG
jgi:hypothetical protein